MGHQVLVPRVSQLVSQAGGAWRSHAILPLEWALLSGLVCLTADHQEASYFGVLYVGFG